MVTSTKSEHIALIGTVIQFSDFCDVNMRVLWSGMVWCWSLTDAAAKQKGSHYFWQRQPTVWRMISRTCSHKHNRLSWRIGWRMSQFWRSKCIRCCGDGRQSYKLSLLLHCWYVLPWHSLLLLLTSLGLSVQGCTQTEFFMPSLQAETSSLESIDTWSGFAGKMMRMMML